MNHQFPTTTTTTNSPNSCSNCYIDDRFLLHNVRLRGTHRRLCTSCVLKLHPCSFCPHCFLIFDNNNPQIPQPNIANRGILRCLKCPSESHSNCVPAHVPKSPFLCPPCSNPTFKFFDLRGGKSNGGDGEVGIDERAAKVLVAAARIAADSMRKAAGLARVEAERRVKEAAVARKRAREALERIVQLSAREGERGIRNGVSEGVRHVDGSVMENGSREKNAVVAPLPMDVKGSDCALELKKEGLIGGGISQDINSSVIGRIDEGSEVENSKVHMDVDAAVSRSMDGSNGVSPLGKVVDDINGKLGSDGNTIVAVHMDVDAVDLPSKDADIAAGEVAAIGTVDDEIDIVNELEKALGQDVKSEDVPMDADAPVAIQNKNQIVDSEGLVIGAVVEDVGDRGMSADVQTLVVKMEKNGGMIANGSTNLGVVSPPKVMGSAPEVQILDDVNAKDGAPWEEKEISDEKMGKSLPSSSNHEQHLEEKHDEKDGRWIQDAKLRKEVRNCEHHNRRTRCDPSNMQENHRSMRPRCAGARIELVLITPVVTSRSM
ncbi:hypothetical protein AKJ16_DCAP00546, partial [Drosera capensis]